MCHIVLLMPLLALPLFWVLPLTTAATVYGMLVALSAWLYYYVIKSMRQPAATGREWLLHASGKVVALRPDGRVVLRVGSENWTGHSNDSLAVGDRIAVCDIEGLDLKVVGEAAANHEPQASGTGGEHRWLEQGSAGEPPEPRGRRH